MLMRLCDAQDVKFVCGGGKGPRGETGRQGVEETRRAAWPGGDSPTPLLSIGEQDWDFGKLLPGIRAAAKKLTDAPKHETTTDFWGNINRHPIKPGQLVNRKTCTWYLDDLQAQCAAYRGFVALARGRRKQAARQFERIRKLDPMVEQLQAAGSPTLYTRLQFAVKHGYLIGLPEETKLLSTRQHAIAFLADFHYVKSDFAGAMAIYQKLLDGKAGALRPGAGDYLLYAIGLCELRTGHAADAIASWEQVLASHEGTLTEYRAAWAIVHLAQYHSKGKLHERGEALLHALAEASEDNHWTRNARLTLAMNLAKAGKVEQAKAWLRRIPRRDKAAHALAQYLIAHRGAIQPVQPNVGGPGPTRRWVPLTGKPAATQPSSSTADETERP